jgi:hypothetical protein
MTSSTAVSRARLGALVATACVAVAVLVPAPALAATSVHAAGRLVPADASGAPGGDGGGTDGSPSGPQPPFGGGGSSGGSSSSGSVSDPSGPSDSDSDDSGAAGGVPHPLPGNHGGGGGTNVASPSTGATDSGVVSQVSDFVQNLLRSISSFLGSSNNTSPASSGAGDGDEKPAKPGDAHSSADEQAGAPKQDRLAVGSTNSERRANRQQGHAQPTVDDVVFSVQSGVDRVIGSVVRR